MTTIVDLDQQYVLQTYARPNFVIERGEGCYLYDTDGHKYLDCVAGIAVNALGYADPDVTAAITQHAGGLLHLSNLYHNTSAAVLAKMLADSCCVIDRVFFSNSGAEANEGAIKFARRYARDRHGEGKNIVVAFDGSFHGRTMGAVAITAREKYREPFAPVMPGVRFGEYNNIDQLDELITADVCAVVIEPIQGEGGLRVADVAYLQKIRALCDHHDALLIYDEVQCGVGRTGKMWAHPCEAKPDIMTIAKPLGGGLPIGAILMRQKVADTIHAGDHGSTFAGGPFVTAVAQVVFNKISQPEFLTHVREVSDYLDESLQDLMQRHAEVTELRGKGLMRGIRMTIPVSTVREKAHDEQLLIATAGDDVVRLVPPLIMERHHVDEMIGKLEKAIVASK
ncbi:MAG: aspartate aminotransferase family protein [Chloroflexi bacterium]|nr:aspartate aminotransferase family protein [Chloroflexota bacterium]